MIKRFGSWIMALVVAVVVIGGGIAFVNRGPGGYTVTAHFSASTGLYKGSSVRVLGVPVGSVKSITPEGTTVRVVMTVKKSVKVPSDASAFIIPPSLVSDRYVQLSPAFTKGTPMADKADIPLARSKTPVELDEIIGGLDKLFKGLGPDGVNKQGALSRAVTTGAKVLKGTGGDINTTLVQLSSAVQALANGGDDFSSIITNLANFGEVLAESDDTVRRFTSNLAGASQQLADQRKDLGLALKNLASALDQIGSLVRDHRESLVGDIDILKQVSDTVISRQRDVKEVLDLLPLVVTNTKENIDFRTPDAISFPVRNNFDQTSDPAPIFLCQLLKPILGLADCLVPETDAPLTPNGVAGPPLKLTPLTKASSASSTVPMRSGNSGPDLWLTGLMAGAR